MPDRDDAARWYDEHREDLLQWTQDPPPSGAATPKRRRGAMVSARFSQEEVATLRAAAEVRGVSLSELVRDAALRVASVEAAGPQPAPTTEDIRAVVREELAAARRMTLSPSLTASTIIELTTRRPA